MTKSLFLEAYKSLNMQNSTVGKELVLQSVDLVRGSNMYLDSTLADFHNEYASKMFLDRTRHVHVSILSNDRQGLEITIYLKKSQGGTIRIEFHKKRTATTSICFDRGVKYVIDDYSSHSLTTVYFDKESLFIDSLLSEVPSVLSEYISTVYSRKWSQIKPLCAEVIRFESSRLSFDVNIETTYRGKRFVYKS